VRTLRVQILTPDSPAIVIDDAASVVVPSMPGSFGVLAGHAPMVAPVGLGVLRCASEAGVCRYYVVGDGAAEISSSDGLILMVGFAKPAKDQINAEDMLDKLARTA
jgi:F0F1-type ATP synthase epsilon subunit